MTDTTTGLTEATTDDEIDELAVAGALRPVGQPAGGGDLADEWALRAALEHYPRHRLTTDAQVEGAHAVPSTQR